MQSLIGFARETLVTPRGLPDPDESVSDRVHRLDERIATTSTLTWSIVSGAGLVGATAFARLVRADPATPTSTLIVRATVCTWSLVAIALAKSWHAQAQAHTTVMKELLLVHQPDE